MSYNFINKKDNFNFQDEKYTSKDSKITKLVFESSPLITQDEPKAKKVTTAQPIINKEIIILKSAWFISTIVLVAVAISVPYYLLPVSLLSLTLAVGRTWKTIFADFRINLTKIILALIKISKEQNEKRKIRAVKQKKIKMEKKKQELLLILGAIEEDDIIKPTK